MIGGLFLAAIAAGLWGTVGRGACWNMPGLSCNEHGVRAACASRHPTFAIDIFNAVSDTKSRMLWARRNNYIGEYNGDSSSYGKIVNDDGIDDALTHSYTTARLACKAHDDTFGRGTRHARDIALDLMNKREECPHNNVNAKYMDFNNNKVGASLMQRLTRTKCTVRIGYIFGSFCAVRKQVPPSSGRVWAELYRLAKRAQYTANPRAHKYNGNLIYFNATDRTNGRWVTSDWGRCSGMVRCRSVQCYVGKKRVGNYRCKGREPRRCTWHFSCRRRRGCFPSEASLMLQNGSEVRVDEIQAGDSVLVANRNGEFTYKQVFLSSSRQSSNQTNEYLNIATDSGDEITVTGNHYLQVGPTCCSNTSLVLASEVQPGDTVWTISGNVSSRSSSDLNTSAVPSKVAVVYESQEVGLHNVYTLESRHHDASHTTGFGALDSFPVVNGVVASSFSADMPLIASQGFATADAFMDPLREIFKRTDKLSNNLAASDHLVASNLGLELSDVANDCLAQGDACTQAVLHKNTAKVFCKNHSNMGEKAIKGIMEGMNAHMRKLSMREQASAMADVMSDDSASLYDRFKVLSGSIESCDQLATAVGVEVKHFVARVEAAKKAETNSNGDASSKTKAASDTNAHSTSEQWWSVLLAGTVAVVGAVGAATAFKIYQRRARPASGEAGGETIETELLPEGHCAEQQDAVAVTNAADKTDE